MCRCGSGLVLGGETRCGCGKAWCTLLGLMVVEEGRCFGGSGVLGGENGGRTDLQFVGSECGGGKTGLQSLSDDEGVFVVSEDLRYGRAEQYLYLYGQCICFGLG